MSGWFCLRRRRAVAAAVNSVTLPGFACATRRSTSPLSSSTGSSSGAYPGSMCISMLAPFSAGQSRTEMRRRTGCRSTIRWKAGDTRRARPDRPRTRTAHRTPPPATPLGRPCRRRARRPAGGGAAARAGAGTLRIDAFDGRLDLAFHERTSRPGAQWTQVGGDFAIRVGGPHVLSSVDRTGEVRRETARLAASTLIWEAAGVSYRLEGDLTRPEAIRIAESLEVTSRSAAAVLKPVS